jgi:glycosyltransferase involved in cell wall biosynthesis
MNISVIISTYNQPKWLEKALWAWAQQTHPSFEVLVADDGSGEETQDLIQQMSRKVNYPLKHIWHEDRGFQKCEILNKAILESSYDYLLFTDGDCLPRADLLAIHASFAEEGYFLSGSYLKLTKAVSDSITRSDLESGDIFSPEELIKRGQPKTSKMLKLKPVSVLTPIFDWLTSTKATWNGHCSSGWKTDILAVNGHNETMKYGGEDRELGERLINFGIKAKQIRHHSCLLHLDHPRSYVDPQLVATNKQIRKMVVKNKITWTDHGIKK